MALSTPAADLPIQEESGIKIKKEKDDDDQDTNKEKSPSAINKFIVSDPQLSGLQSRNITITVAASQAGKVVTPSKPSVQVIQKKQPSEDKTKSDPPPIDHLSICGAFGWATVGSVHLPTIMRGDEKYVAVKMFESKIVFGCFPNIFPPAVFTCTNINSYYLTQNEAKLLNEINSSHCDYQFGYNEFSAKDYVVRIKDALKLFEFLEFCQSKLYSQNSGSTCNNKCGFLLHYKIPYIRKGTKQYISLDTIYTDDIAAPVSNSETVTNWDLAYLRFLSCFESIDLQKFKVGKSLCNVEDLELALGVRFEEAYNWPEIRFSSKEDWESFLHPRTLQWLSQAAPQTPIESVDDSKKRRKKLNEFQDKDNLLNSFLGLNKYLDVNSSIPRPAHVRTHEPQTSINLLQGNEKSLFPVSIENFLATSSSCNYPYPVNYNHYNSHIQTPSVLEYDRYRKPDESLSSFPSRKPRSFPPPPPLVRLASASSVADQSLVPKTPSSLYPYIPAASSASCPPWLARILEPDWLHEDDNRSVVQPSDTPENLSRRLNESDAWCPTSLSSTSNGAGSSRSTSNSLGIMRENYDLSHGSLCERVLHPHGGSPRLLAGPGPPPHYPTPPQSSPLQSLSLLDCTALPGFTDIYSTGLTANGLDLCSPPPSPEMRTALSGSPRGSHLSSYGYQPHVTRLVQVDSRYVLAINIEPLKYNSHLAVPISDVVNKFLRGTSVQSCQIMLETVFGLHLYECTSLQQEAFAKHNLSILPGSKLVLLTDLKNCLYQLKVLLLEREKQNDKQYDLGASELPLAKRWCGNAREC